MSRDLIVANLDHNLHTLKHLSSIFVREVIAIDHSTHLEPVMRFFKTEQTHFGIVTKVDEP